MDSRQIREILKGTFHDPKDRKYWEDALKEAEQRERVHQEKVKMYGARYTNYIKEFERTAAKRDRETRAIFAEEAKLQKKYMESATRKK